MKKRVVGALIAVYNTLKFVANGKCLHVAVRILWLSVSILSCALSCARRVPLRVHPVQLVGCRTAVASCVQLHDDLSLRIDLSVPPKDVLKANAVNPGGILRFQPFHCDPWLSSAFLI